MQIVLSELENNETGFYKSRSNLLIRVLTIHQKSDNCTMGKHKTVVQHAIRREADLLVLPNYLPNFLLSTRQDNFNIFPQAVLTII